MRVLTESCVTRLDRLRSLTYEEDGFVIAYSTQPSSTRYWVGYYKDAHGGSIEFRKNYKQLMSLADGLGL